MAVKLKIENEGLEYAMVASRDDPTIKEFVGYREGIEFDADGTCINPGIYVDGSNNGWYMQAAVGEVQIYVRRLSK